MIKVLYSVDDHISAFKIYFEKLQALFDFRKEKLDIFDGIQEIIKVNNDVSRDLYKKYLIKTGTYVEEEFEEKIKAIVYANPMLEEDYELHVKCIAEQAQNWIGELMKFLNTIRLNEGCGPLEKKIESLVLRKKKSRKIDNLEILLMNLKKTYLDFSVKKAAIFERLEQLIPGSPVFTVRQKKLLEDIMNLADLVEKSLKTLRIYDETRIFTEALIKYYEDFPESESELKVLVDIRSQLSTLYLVIQLMLRTPSDEAKMIEEYLIYIHEVRGKVMNKRGSVEDELVMIQEEKKTKEFDKTKMEKQMRKLFSSKKYAKEQVRSYERDLTRLAEEEAFILEDFEKLESNIKLYDELANRMEITSEYRKKLNKIVDLSKEYEKKLSYIGRPRKYFERSTELTEIEQTKIILKILAEQEDTLSSELIVKEIIDMKHFRDYMKSVIRVFKTPSLLGFKPTYRTDYIWVTVETPLGLWSEDLTQELFISLAGYVTSEVSRTVTVRVIDSRDPWIIRILVVGGRGKPEDLEAFDEMKLLYSKASEFEKNFSRSYLLEHGISAIQLIEKIKNINKEK